MSLSSGTRLGLYEILSPLGAGGMGEVYRARDSRLHREVAIKVLPAAFAADTERLARFDREARVLASLNHPAIASIYGLEESGGTRFLVLELVEGETLAERIAAGPVPVEETLVLCRQIAEALEGAHEKGIVHRDLKPANIKVTPAGKVKVLDFGLAKAFAPETRVTDLSHSPTVTSGGTQHGVVLGTAAYMSPEQARGKPVDRRTDIWSFGCVFYELLTGRRAFEGETVSDVMVSVLSREPDWNELPADTPPRVRELLRRCLRKDPERRLHDAADARLEIEDAREAPSPATEVVLPERRRRSFLAWIALAFGAAAIGALAAWQLARRGASAAKAEPSISKLARITHDAGRAEWPVWSPDSTLLAYASNRDGNYDIFVRRGEGGQDVNVTNDPGQDIQPTFSSDGNSIAFISTRSSRTGLIRIGGTLARNVRTYGGDLWVVPALGGAARRLAPDANTPVWRPDGKGIVYVSGDENRRTVLEVPAGGGAPRTLLRPDDATWELNRLACSPDGRWITLEEQLAGILVMPAEGGKPHMLVPNGFGHAWDAAGRLYFVTTNPQGGTRLQVAEIDASEGKIRGEPQTIGLVTGSLWELSVSADGRRIAASEEEASRHLTRLPLGPGGTPSGSEESLSSGRVTDAYPSVSPDNRQVAYVSDILGHSEVWILDLEKQQRRRVQLPGEDISQTGPAWMPDGRHLAISRLITGNIATNWLVAVDGSGAEEVLTRAGYEGVGWLLAPTLDGKRLFYPAKSATGVQQIYVLDLASRKSRQITDGPGNKFDIVISPDEKTIAVTGIQDGVVQLFRSGIDGGPMQQLTTGYERMRHPFFSPDGKWIYIQPSHRNIHRVPAGGGALEQVTKFPEAGLFLEEPTISPDGRYLYYCRGSGGSSLWLVTVAGGDSVPPAVATTPAP